MLGQPRIGSAQEALAHALATMSALFSDAGHTPVAVPHLHPGEALLDVYGEDLRARAFLFADAERGEELCLRPDFTVPVALAHGESGWDRQASYAYQGPVFRRQPAGLGRPVEYSQAGIERFGDPDPVEADAAVLALLHRGLATLGVARPQVTIGDLSIPFALLGAGPGCFLALALSAAAGLDRFEMLAACALGGLLPVVGVLVACHRDDRAHPSSALSPSISPSAPCSSSASRSSASLRSATSRP